MLTRIRPRLVVELARRDLPRPVDVVNLISTEHFASYRWYALLVSPALALVGSRVRWMGRFERSLHGERQADKLLLVRYRSHRHFLAMTLNPYYLTINRLREAGVRSFQGSFTHPSHAEAGLHRRRSLLAVHVAGDDALEAVTAIVAPAVGELVYATRAVASLDILYPPAATDPRPLEFPSLALFAVGEDDVVDADGLATRLAAVTEGFSLQLYRREPRSTYRPSFRAGEPATA
jgi:uncharacterized protein (DUF1330 family)